MDVATPARRTIARRALAFSLLAVCIAVVGSAAVAQDVRQYKDLDRYRYLPRLPQGSENPEPLPDVPREVQGDPKILVDELRALVFVDSPDDVDPGRLDMTGVHIRSDYGLDLLRTERFHRIAEKYLGGHVSSRRLNELIREIIMLYRDDDQPVVDVRVPQQEISDGVVQLVVTEAVVGDVRVEGPCYFDPCVLARQVCISPGDTIYESVLMEDLRWLYRNPYRRVELEMLPGERRGETDIVFNVFDEKPVRVYAGYEDTGNPASGLERTFYGINWYNALNRDDQTGYQYTAASDFDSLGAHSAYYSTALCNRDILTLYGSYAEFNSRIAPPGNDNTGQTWQLLARWYRELCPWGCYEHGVTAGFDYKNTNTDIDFGGIQVFDSDADICQFMIGYVGHAEDYLGSWSIGADAYLSPGHLSGKNNNQRFNQIRQGATANYAYTRAFAERRFWLPQCFEFVARVTGQLSEGNLLPTEQLGFGGYNSVRGYDLYSIVGDSGYFFNLEIQTPVYHLSKCCCDELRFHVFYDQGDAYNHTLLVGEDPSVDLKGTGLGFRYRMEPNLEVRFDYGWQLADLGLPIFGDERVHLGVVLSR